MNEELIARMMTEQGMTREQAIATLQNTNSVDMQFLNAFFQGSPYTQNQMFGGQVMPISDQYTNNVQYGTPSAPMQQQPSVLNNPSQPLFNRNGGLDWSLMSGNQGIQNPYQQPTQYSVPSAQEDLGSGGGLPSLDQGTQVTIGDPTNSDPSTNQVKPSVFDQVSMFASQMNPYGTDLETELYTLGRSAGNISNGQGSPANTLSLIGSAGSALLGGARSALSGFSGAKANNRYWEWMQNRRRQQKYTVNSQTQNTQADALGGITQS